MAAYTFNIAKGRVVELYNRVKSNDPSTSALVCVVLVSSGIQTQAVLEDADSLAAVVSGSTDETTAPNYARKVLTDAELAAFPSPDDNANSYAVTIPPQTWTSIGAGSGTGTQSSWSKLVICYDANTGTGTDSDIIPLTCHDFSATPNGGNITATPNAAGFFSAS